jgi:hypothetical protein
MNNTAPQIQRFEAVETLGGDIGHEPAADGMWVMFDDVAPIIAERDRLAAMLEHISVRDIGGGELFPVGPDSFEHSADGNTLTRVAGPWRFVDGVGETFLEAVADDMAKNPREEERAAARAAR